MDTSQASGSSCCCGVPAKGMLGFRVIRKEGTATLRTVTQQRLRSAVRGWWALRCWADSYPLEQCSHGDSGLREDD